MVRDTDSEKKIHITFHQLNHSAVLGDRIRKKALKLLKMHPFILHNRIVVNRPHHHKHKGNVYQIRMDIKVPGKELVITKQPGVKVHPHFDPYVVVDDAFKAAEHSLQRYKEKNHDIVKHHALPLYGKIFKLKENYGYIESPNSAEIYFHENSLAEGVRFRDLKEGDTVHFIVGDEEGKNLSASLVKPIARHSVIEDMRSIIDITREET